MIRTWLGLAIAGGVGIAIGAGVMAAAPGHHEDGESAKVVSRTDIVEKLDGKEAAVTAVEVTIGPEQGGLPHRHPGPVFVYVAEGEYELGIDDQPTKRFHAGQTFYEPTGCVHRVSRNPSKVGTTKLIAFVLHPRNVNEVALPEQVGH
jgi:quercetin dioxygenase-like cupin family protein